MSEFNEKLCDEKHKGVDERLEEHEVLLKEHSIEINRLKEDGREFKTEIKNLIEKMDSLINTIKWSLGIFVTIALFIIGVTLNK